MKTAGRKIQDAIEAEEWKKARSLLKEKLKHEPESHWLWTRLSTTYYEVKEYEKALDLSEKAIELAPTCPLIQWDYAGALDMIGKTEQAITVWRRLLRRGKRLNEDPCSEGPEWCAALVNDCRYRLALAYARLAQPDSAIRSLRGFLAGLDAGAESIYDRYDSEARLAKLLNRST